MTLIRGTSNAETFAILFNPPMITNAVIAAITAPAI